MVGLLPRWIWILFIKRNARREHSQAVDPAEVLLQGLIENAVCI